MIQEDLEQKCSFWKKSSWWWWVQVELRELWLYYPHLQCQMNESYSKGNADQRFLFRPPIARATDFRKNSDYSLYVLRFALKTRILYFLNYFYVYYCWMVILSINCLMMGVVPFTLLIGMNISILRWTSPSPSCWASQSPSCWASLSPSRWASESPWWWTSCPIQDWNVIIEIWVVIVQMPTVHSALLITWSAIFHQFF